MKWPISRSWLAFTSNVAWSSLATQVAEQLTAHDAFATHARDELGISDTFSARPVQAAFASAGAFAVGATMPLLTIVIAPQAYLIPDDRQSGACEFCVMLISPQLIINKQSQIAFATISVLLAFISGYPRCIQFIRFSFEQSTLQLRVHVAPGTHPAIRPVPQIPFIHRSHRGYDL